MWSFKDGRVWRHYDVVHNAMIEAEYQRNPSGVLRFSIMGTPYEINLAKMRQTNTYVSDCVC